MIDKIKTNGFKILNGMSIGIVVSLIPGAMFGQIAKYLELTQISMFLNISTYLMCLLIGIGIALQYKFDAISSGALAISTMIAGGAFKGVHADGYIMLQGSGDVLNASIGAIIAVLIIVLIQDKLKAFKLLVLPLLVILVVGIITSLTAAPIGAITAALGNMINTFTTFQPLLMSVLIALSFGIIIVSPISTVAIALLIQLTGLGSAAANLGCTGVAITLCILAYRTNGMGTALAHFIGSPKIQMANFIKSPKMLIPPLFAGFISSLSVPIFQLQGTPTSAGFGISGLIGPLGHLEMTSFSTYNLLIVGLCFFIIPTIAAFLSVYIFRDRLKVVEDEQYRLHF